MTKKMEAAYDGGYETIPSLNQQNHLLSLPLSMHIIIIIVVIIIFIIVIIIIVIIF